MTATLPSERLGIEGEVAALSVDLAVAFRLSLLEQEQADHQARLIAAELSKIFSGGDGSSGNSDVIDLIKNDPYADKDTQVW